MSKPIVDLRIDEQYDFVPGGSLAVAEGVDAINAGNIINSNGPFIATISTQDWHPKNDKEKHISFATTHNVKVLSVKKITLPDETEDDQVMWPDHCVQGTDGAKFHSSKVVNPNIPHEVVQKGCNPGVDSYSGFGDAYGGKFEKTNMHELLQKYNAKGVVVHGLALDYCVAYTAKDAIKMGYKVCVPLWACRGVAPDTITKEKANMLAMGVTLAENQAELDAWYATF
jgi:nicotinamidase/pyrazinamidase